MTSPFLSRDQIHRSLKEVAIRLMLLSTGKCAALAYGVLRLCKVHRYAHLQTHISFQCRPVWFEVELGVSSFGVVHAGRSKTQRTPRWHNEFSQCQPSIILGSLCRRRRTALLERRRPQGQGSSVRARVLYAVPRVHGAAPRVRGLPVGVQVGALLSCLRDPLCSLPWQNGHHDGSRCPVGWEHGHVAGVFLPRSAVLRRGHQSSNQAV